jgi:hypothetical protein
MNKLSLVITLLVATILIVTAANSSLVIQTAMAKETPYQAGYDHGCDDAKISNADARYINQPDNGPSNHTPEFMSGYDAGFSVCSGSGSPSSRDNSDNSGRGGSSNTGQSQSYKDGFALGKSRAMEAIQELHDGKNDKVDENDEGECPSTDKDFCSGLFDGWHNTILEGTTADQRLD